MILLTVLTVASLAGCADPDPSLHLVNFTDGDVTLHVQVTGDEGKAVLDQDFALGPRETKLVPMGVLPEGEYSVHASSDDASASASRRITWGTSGIEITYYGPGDLTVGFLVRD